MTRPAERPWRDAFPNAARWDAPITPSTLPALLDDTARRNGDKPAIEFRERHISYRALREAADRVAAGLAAAGIGRGDAVALYLPNTPWHPISFFALGRLGVRIVHLSALDAPRELVHKLKDSGARRLITTDLPAVLPTALRLLEEGAVETILVGDDARFGPLPIDRPDIPWSDSVRPVPEADPPPHWPTVSPDDVCLLQYTGGTTGLPKGAILTHGNLTAAVAIYRNWLDGAATAPGTHKVVAVLPFFHIYGLTAVLLRHLGEGNELLLRMRFDVETLIEDIAVKRASVVAAVPTMWIALLNHPKAASMDVASLRSCITGGAPMPFDVEQRIEKLVGQRLWSGWGMTETAPAGTRVLLGAPPAAGLVGIPLPAIDVRIVDRDAPARVLPPGEAGEIAIRGPNVFQGYWNKPADTAAAFCEGYFLTGDIGKMDESGLFTILDRKKNMIISSGFNVYPAAVENAIYEHPDVVEVIVIGVPDAYRGQAAKAFVTLRPGATPLTLDELKAFLADRLGRHEMPAALELRDQLPKSPAGKLLAKVLIEEELAKTGAPGGTP